MERLCYSSRLSISLMLRQKDIDTPKYNKCNKITHLSESIYSHNIIYYILYYELILTIPLTFLCYSVIFVTFTLAFSTIRPNLLPKIDGNDAIDFQRLTNKMHFFEKKLPKNLEKPKCLTYLCSAFRKRRQNRCTVSAELLRRRCLTLFINPSNPSNLSHGSADRPERSVGKNLSN